MPACLTQLLLSARHHHARQAADTKLANLLIQPEPLMVRLSSNFTIRMKYYVHYPVIALYLDRTSWLILRVCVNKSSQCLF